LMGLCWPYIRSGSTYLVVVGDKVSRGLCSSPRIDLVLFSRLKGLGLLRLAKFAEAEAEAEAEELYARGWSEGAAGVGTSVLGGAPTGLRVVDLSRGGSMSRGTIVSKNEIMEMPQGGG
jgi:hypothetical protein